MSCAECVHAGCVSLCQGGPAPKAAVYRPKHSSGAIAAMMNADRLASGARKLTPSAPSVGCLLLLGCVGYLTVSGLRRVPDCQWALWVPACQLAACAVVGAVLVCAQGYLLVGCSFPPSANCSYSRNLWVNAG